MTQRSISVFALSAFAGLLLAACSSASDADDATVEGRSALIDADGRKVLPNWATDEEAAIERLAPAPRAPRSEQAPASGFRVPAEYAPVSTVVMTWAGHPDVLRGISTAAAAAGANVWMVGGPASMDGVAAEKYRPLSFAFDSIWPRDYGPV